VWCLFGWRGVRAVVPGRARVQAAWSAAITQSALTCQVLEVPQEHGLGGADAGGLDDGVLAVDGCRGTGRGQVAQVAVGRLDRLAIHRSPSGQFPSRVIGP
jgi:hypothetical protein